MKPGSYAVLAQTVESKLDPRVMEAALGPSPPPGSLLAEFGLRVLRNLDMNTTPIPDEDTISTFFTSVRDLAEELRRSIK